MKRVEISGSQYFSPLGFMGAFLVIFSPLLDAACYWWFISELALPYGGSLFLPGLGLIACSIAFFSGLVMVIIGREHEFTVREIDAAPNPSTRTAKRIWEL